MDAVRIGSRYVGPGHPCVLIAEIGSNHNGDLDLALRLIEISAASGVDAVKFQLFRAEHLYNRDAGKSDYLGSETDIYEIIEAAEMPLGWLPELSERAHSLGLLFLVSAFDEASVDDAAPFVDAFKVASYEMTHIPLIRHTAACGKPLIVSTGTASMQEVADTMTVLNNHARGRTILMQCTASYPAPLNALDLKAIPSMAQAFGVPVGFSDHSEDPLIAPLTALGLGAVAIEKHITLDRSAPGPDHRYAIEPDDLTKMVTAVRHAESALGDGSKKVQDVELELRAFARRSVFATAEIAEGEDITVANAAVLRNGKAEPGADPADYPGMLTKRAARKIGRNDPIRLQDLRDP